MHTLSRFFAFSVVAVSLAACSKTAPVVPPAPHSSSSSEAAISSSSSAGQQGKDVVIDAPAVGSLVRSPLVVKGKARGTWFFEAQLPVQLQDSNGNVIATATAPAEGEWQTADYVGFTVTLPFSTKASSGFVVVKKDNPSGLPENDAQVMIPVTF